MAYLRHHASPLLDWTSSPYVAAYFAFEGCQPAEDKRVAIFAYVEEVGGGKGRTGGHPYIFSLGPSIRVHKRHFVQRSEYTICYRTPEGGEDEAIPDLHYSHHEAAFLLAEERHDLLFKITLPACEGNEALRYLELHDINRYSLFETTDALMQALASREYVLDD